MTVPVRIRDDLGVPALVLQQRDRGASAFPVRQPDADTLRLWEVARTSHRSGAANEKALAPLFRSVYGRRRAKAAYKWQHSSCVSWLTAMLARWSSASVW